MCTETLASSTPKYSGTVGENTPPYSNELKPPPPYSDRLLLCTETLCPDEDTDAVLKSAVTAAAAVEQTSLPAVTKHASFHHPPVKADCDTIILRDDRVIQNLLKNEER